MNWSADQAKQLLSHYLRHAGVIKTSDGIAEVESIVDLIIDAAKEETIKEVRKEIQKCK